MGERLGVDPEGREVWMRWSMRSPTGIPVPIVTALERGSWVYQVIVPVPYLVGLLRTLHD